MIKKSNIKLEKGESSKSLSVDRNRPSTLEGMITKKRNNLMSVNTKKLKEREDLRLREDSKKYWK
jgi:hypothetical protein